MKKKGGGVELPFAAPIQNLTAALASKGTAGTIFLGLIVLVIWVAPLVFMYLWFDWFPKPAIKEWTDSGSLGGVLALSGLAAIVLAIFAGLLISREVLGQVVPIIRAESDAAGSAKLAQAFGGRPTLASALAGLSIQALPAKQAQSLALEVLKALQAHATRLVADESVKLRANVLVTEGGKWLRLRKELAVGMQGSDANIKIPNGYLSSGTAYHYFVPVVSIKRNGKWPFDPDSKALKSLGISAEEVKAELKKTPDKLSWIISMPIPFQIEPFRLCCGAINLDGVGSEIRNERVLRELLADECVAASIIGLINRRSDILGGQCQRPPSSDIEIARFEEEVRSVIIQPAQFDPADVPEPTRDFLADLGRIRRLAVLRKAEPQELSDFLKEQLAS